MWSRDRLAELVEKRKAAKALLPKAEEATLAYARWQGLTAEKGVDREAAKAALDKLCDETEPEEWGRLRELAGNIDDGILKGVMHYTLTRSLEQIREQQRALEPEPEKRPVRRRSRERDR